MSIEQDKIIELENRVAKLNRIIALHNEDKYEIKSKASNEKLSDEEIGIKVFSMDGNLFTKVLVPKHADSDNTTEKSYVKFHEIIDVFKIK